ncbi:MAG: hypothetical protein KGZ71_09810 [Desulfobulbaceae bacterium]|nr:hypothetical protein [Desulfobulbaceae bacterium]
MENELNNYVEYRNGIKISEYQMTVGELWKAVKEHFMNDSSDIVYLNDEAFTQLCEQREVTPESQDWYDGEGLYDSSKDYELLFSPGDEEFRHDSLTIIKI